MPSSRHLKNSRFCPKCWAPTFWKSGSFKASHFEHLKLLVSFEKSCLASLWYVHWLQLPLTSMEVEGTKAMGSRSGFRILAVGAQLFTRWSLACGSMLDRDGYCGEAKHNFPVIASQAEEQSYCLLVEGARYQISVWTLSTTGYSQPHHMEYLRYVISTCPSQHLEKFTISLAFECLNNHSDMI